MFTHKLNCRFFFSVCIHFLSLPDSLECISCMYKFCIRRLCQRNVCREDVLVSH